MTWLGAAISLTGALLVLVAGVGLLRMPDLYARMQATSKAATLGVALVSTAVALHLGDSSATWRAALIIAFLGATAPVAAHAVARAAHRTGVPLAAEARIDELYEHRRQRTDAPPDAGD